jgi:hypothetical protein
MARAIVNVWLEPVRAAAFSDRGRPEWTPCPLHDAEAYRATFTAEHPALARDFAGRACIGIGPEPEIARNTLTAALALARGFAAAAELEDRTLAVDIHPATSLARFFLDPRRVRFRAA